MKGKVKTGTVCRRYRCVRLAATLCLCLCAGTLSAQHSYRLKGIAVDTASGFKMANTTIYVLRSKDSMLVNFTYAAADGSFSIDVLPAGNFILLMTYPDYADYAETFALDDTHPLHDLHTIVMQSRFRLLQEVIVKGEARAIRVNGDTTEFNAKAYVIQPNDKVEDLLKQLPGIQVDKDGKITANGERVNKVLLDGEEFFGDDPTLVTKNIRADMVSKIQLYDKKSDQATFTGIDDGVKIKTINVQLKEDKKAGVFGKAEGGIGTGGYTEAQVLYNSFKHTEKYAAYATAANDGKITLGQSDNNTLGASGNSVQIGDVIIVSRPADDQDAGNGTYNGNGLPMARTGGLHYDGKFNDGNSSLNTNYKIGSLEVNGTQLATGQQSLPTGTINTNTNRTFDNYAFRQKLDAAYTIKPDTSSTIKIAADGTLKNTQSKSDYFTTTDMAGMLLNQNTQSLTGNGDHRLFDASVLYTKKFKKPRRTFSWNVSEAYTRNQTSGYQNSVLNFYNALGLKDSTQTINQYKMTDITTSILSSNMTWSEPLSNTLSVVANYGVGINNSSADRESFDQSASGRYEILDTVYSNNYRFNQLTNQVGAIVNYKQGKTTLNFGTKLSGVDFKQINEFTGSISTRGFLNWAPQAYYLYRASQQESFTFNYNGNTTQPRIDQIQPVPVNTNPLNVILGNPDLKPSFSNNLKFSYRQSHPISGLFFGLSGNYSFVSGAIVNNIFTDATGKTTTQYVNLSRGTPFNYGLDADLNFKIKPVDVGVEVELNATGSVGYSYINNTPDRSGSYTYAAIAEFRKTKQKAYYFQLTLAPSYTVNQFSLQPQSNNNAAGMYSDFAAEFYLPAQFQVKTGGSYSYKAKTAVLDAEQRMLLNAGISKTFFKNDNLKLSATVNDLLNQNVNFTRSISANSISQNSYNGIKRYLMFSVTWDFTKFGTVAAQKK